MFLRALMMIELQQFDAFHLYVVPYLLYVWFQMLMLPMPECAFDIPYSNAKHMKNEHEHLNHNTQQFILLNTIFLFCAIARINAIWGNKNLIHQTLFCRIIFISKQTDSHTYGM